MSLSSGLVTITFRPHFTDGPFIVVHWGFVPRKGEHVYLRRADDETGDDIVIDGLVENVAWTDEGVTIRVR